MKDEVVQSSLYNAPAASGSPWAAWGVLSTPILVLTPDAMVAWMNDAAVALLGHRVTGPLAPWAPDLVVGWTSVWAHRGTHTVYGSVLCRDRKEEVRVKATLSVMLDVDRLGVNDPTLNSGAVLVELLVLDDVMNQEQETLMRHMQEAHRQLLRNLAHEVKNPLGGLRGAAQLLAFELNGEHKDYTDLMVGEADRLQELIDRFVEPYRRGPDPTDVDIHHVLMAVESLIGCEYPRLQFVRDYDVSLPPLLADESRLKQIFLNLIKNAAQALGQTPEPTIKLSTRLVRDVMLPKGRAKRALQIRVEDNGPGIPDALLGRLFYPLVTGRPDGTGLGLSLVQTYCQQAGASVSVTSTPGLTVFTVIWPLR